MRGVGEEGDTVVGDACGGEVEVAQWNGSYVGESGVGEERASTKSKGVEGGEGGEEESEMGVDEAMEVAGSGSGVGVVWGQTGNIP